MQRQGEIWRGQILEAEILVTNITAVAITRLEC